MIVALAVMASLKITQLQAMFIEKSGINVSPHYQPVFRRIIWHCYTSLKIVAVFRKVVCTLAHRRKVLAMSEF